VNSLVFRAEKLLLSEKSGAFSQLDAFFYKPVKVPVSFEQRPVQPADCIILAPAVVVAFCSSRKFISSGHHRYSLGDKEEDEKAFHAAKTQFNDIPSVGFSFATTVPADVVVLSIPVVLTVGVVMFFIVADKVIEGETIMTGDEIDGAQGAPAVLLVKI